MRIAHVCVCVCACAWWCVHLHVSLQVVCWEHPQTRCVALIAKHSCGQSPLLTEQGSGDGRGVSSIWKQTGKGSCETCKKVKSN